MTKPSIQQAYIAYSVTNEDLLDDVEDFCIAKDIAEGDFYIHFEDIAEVQRNIWEDWMVKTLTALGSDAQFETFSGREQLLAFYYTHLSVLQPHREYVRLHRHSMYLPLITPSWMQPYKESFLTFAKGLLSYGSETGEIADRWLLNTQYDKGLWSQLLFVLQFWLRDESTDQEKTDAVIDKAVSLSYELVRPSIVDSAVDFAKFMFQNWRSK